MSNPVFDSLLGAVMLHAHTEIPAAVLQDTRANILATSAATVRFAVATDNADALGGYEVFFANGSAWYQMPFRLYLKSNAPDMGALQDSSRVGYGIDYVTDKRLSNVSVGDNATTDTGALRFNPTTNKFQVYYSGAWNNAVVGIALVEGSDGRLEQQPQGKTEYYDAFSGNSQTVGLNGLPMGQQFKTDMGAYPAPLKIDGGNADMSNPTTVTDLLNRQIFRLLVRRMTDAQRAALTAYDTLEGELIYATDTKKLYISDGTGTLTALN